MNREQWAATQRVIRGARSITDALKELSVEELKSAIADRERYQDSDRFKAIPDDRARAAGTALTEILRIILRFREEIVNAEPDPEDQARAVEHATNYFTAHPERVPPGVSIADFLEGKS